MSIENVLGLDVETTGLDPASDEILEIGMKVIALDFTTAIEFLVCVKQPPETLSRMSTAVRAQHERSGLLRDCRERGFDPKVAFAEASAFVKKQFPEGKVILLGSSIHFDRGFIRAQIPDLEKQLSHRMIDSSSIREALRIFGSEHRTMSDISRSVDIVREFVSRASRP